MRLPLYFFLATAALSAPAYAQMTVGQLPIAQDGTVLEINAEVRIALRTEWISESIFAELE